jgi:hypothetical protein
VLIRVDGGEPPRPKVTTFAVPRLVSEGPIDVEAVLDAGGDSYITASGTLDIVSDDSVKAVELADQVVVPEQPRSLQPDPGDTRPLRVGSAKLGPGRHEVTLRLRVEPTGTTLVSRAYVWVIPPWLWALIAALALVVATCIALVVRWLMQRSQPAAMAPAASVDTPGDGDDDSLDPSLIAAAHLGADGLDIDLDFEDDDLEDDDLEDSDDPELR